MSCDKSLDLCDECVDPRVQVQLERLNTATDEINKLEVDLDESRNQFRLLLAESTVRIDGCAKKLGSCIDKARPYYDARIKAKEALQETQKAAVQFEKANSAHAAAKEMVYLAEEGLKTEGRTFDHAWQEMLNHATMRVNESEAERTLSEVEHKRTSQMYQQAETRVQTLQKELKRVITKSSLSTRRQLLFLSTVANQHNLLFLPYFELKIQYNMMLEQQNKKVKSLEKQVSQVKSSYAETLRNLEQISDEIHKTRQNVKIKSPQNEVIDIDLPVTNNEQSAKVNNHRLQTTIDDNKLLTPISETNVVCNKMTPNTPGSSQPDTDLWSSESCDVAANGDDDDDSSVTGPPDSESDDDFFNLPDKLYCGSTTSVNDDGEYLPASADQQPAAVATKEKYNLQKEIFQQLNQCWPVTSETSTVDICSFPQDTEFNFNFAQYKDIDEDDNSCNRSNKDIYWTEINLNSPNNDKTFTKFNKNVNIKSNEEDFDIPYTPLPELENDINISVNPLNWDLNTDSDKQAQSLSTWLNKSQKTTRDDCEAAAASTATSGVVDTPKKLLNRRQSLDVLWNNATGEKVKEILSHGILKLSIGTRCSEPKQDENEEIRNASTMKEGEVSTTTYESNLSSQFGLQFFTRKMKSDTDDTTSQSQSDDVKYNGHNDLFTNQIGGLIGRKDRFFTKKVPSPLERSKSYLNTEEDSNSDCESLSSMDMITDDLLCSLVLDKDLTEIYKDVL